jgi:hypothetical protein
VLVQHHPLYMRRLAETYLSKYSMLGYEVASKWYEEFLDDGLRSKIKPYIQMVAEERNLEVD